VRLNVPDEPANDSDNDEPGSELKKRPRKPALELEQWGKADRNRASEQLTWAANLQVDWSQEQNLVSTGKFIEWMLI
jgi:hypothetical protein